MAKQTEPALSSKREEAAGRPAPPKIVYSPEETALRLKLARDHRANKRVGPGWTPKIVTTTES